MVPVTVQNYPGQFRAEDHALIITQNGEPGSVLQDPRSFEYMRKAIGILKLISQGEEDIKKVNTKTQEEVFNDIEEMLKMKSQ